MKISQYTKLPLFLTLIFLALISSDSRASQFDKERALLPSPSSTLAPMMTDSQDQIARHNRTIEKIRKENAICGASSAVLFMASTVVGIVFAMNESNEKCQDIFKYGAPAVCGAATIGSLVFCLHNLCKPQPTLSYLQHS